MQIKQQAKPGKDLEVKPPPHMYLQNVHKTNEKVWHNTWQHTICITTMLLELKSRCQNAKISSLNCKKKIFFGGGGTMTQTLVLRWGYDAPPQTPSHSQLWNPGFTTYQTTDRISSKVEPEVYFVLATVIQLLVRDGVRRTERWPTPTDKVGTKNFCDLRLFGNVHCLQWPSHLAVSHVCASSDKTTSELWCLSEGKRLIDWLSKA